MRRECQRDTGGDSTQDIRVVWQLSLMISCKRLPSHWIVVRDLSPAGVLITIRPRRLKCTMVAEQTKGRPSVAKAADKSTTSGSKPQILVTRNGEIFVTPEDVVKSDKFKEQFEKIAKIPVNRDGTGSHR